MRNDTATVNGLTCYVLGTAQTASVLGAVINTYEGSVTVTQYIGIAVLKRTAAGVETQISAGTCVAIASRSTSGTGSATWACPQTALATTDSIVIILLADDVTPPMVQLNEEVSGNLVEFQTEQLGETQLDAVTWTVYYQVLRTYVAGTDETTYRFRWGVAASNSRITNFSHSTPVVALTKYGTATLTFSPKATKTVGFSRAGTSTITFAVASKKATGISLTESGLASLTFATSTLLNWVFNREGLAELMFGKVPSELAWSFPVQGSSALAFVVDSANGILRVFYEEGSADLAILASGLKGVESNFLGSSILTFTENFEKALSFSRQGSGILTFLADSAFKSGQALSFSGEAILNILLDGTHWISRLFSFQGYAPLHFTVESTPLSGVGGGWSIALMVAVCLLALVVGLFVYAELEEKKKRSA